MLKPERSHTTDMLAPLPLEKHITVSLLSNIDESSHLQSNTHSGSNSGDRTRFQTHTSKYNLYQIPPNIQHSQIHYENTVVGKVADPDSKCPCCSEPAKIPYSLFARASMINTNGLEIPFYLKFKNLYLFFLITIIIVSTYNLAAMYWLYCSAKENVDDNGNCLSPSNILAGMRLGMLCETLNDTKQNLIICLEWRPQAINYYKISAWISWLCLGIFYMGWSVFARRMKHWMDDWERIHVPMPSDFTIMVGNVSEEDSEEDIKNLIQKMLKREDYPAPFIVKTNRAKRFDNVQRVDIEIARNEVKLEELRKYIQKNRLFLSSQSLRCLCKKQREYETRIRRLNRKRNSVTGEVLSKSNQIVFVTFEFRSFKDWLLSCTNTSKFTFSEAPYVGEMQWENVGFNRLVRKRNSVIFVTLLWLFVLVFLRIIIPNLMPPLVSFTEWLKSSDNFLVNHLPEFSKPILVTVLSKILRVLVAKLITRRRYLRKGKDVFDLYNFSCLIKISCTVLAIFYSWKLEVKKKSASNFVSEFDILMPIIFSYFSYKVVTDCLISLFYPKDMLRKLVRGIAVLRVRYLGGQNIVQKDFQKYFTRSESKLERSYMIITYAYFVVPLLSLTQPFTIFVIFFGVWLQSFMEKRRLLRILAEPTIMNCEFHLKLLNFKTQLLACSVLTRTLKVIFYPKLFSLTNVYEVARELSLILLLCVGFTEVYVRKRRRRQKFDGSLYKRVVKRFEEDSVLKSESLSELGTEATEAQLFDYFLRKFLTDQDRLLYSKAKKFFVTDYDRENPMTAYKANQKWRDFYENLNDFD